MNCVLSTLLPVNTKPEYVVHVGGLHVQDNYFGMCFEQFDYRTNPSKHMVYTLNTLIHCNLPNAGYNERVF